MQRMIISWNWVNNIGAIPSVTSAPASFSLKGMKIQLGCLTGKLLFDCGPALSRLRWTQCSVELQRKLRVALGLPINGPTPAERPTFEPAEWLQVRSSSSVITPIASPVEALVKCQLMLVLSVPQFSLCELGYIEGPDCSFAGFLFYLLALKLKLI